MRVLVACEESQRVAMAFRLQGHEAFSCDIKDCSGGYPQYHIKDDAKKVALSENWDLIIAHPPCTYLCVAGACMLVDKNGKIKDFQRYEEMLKARDFFMFFYGLSGRVCIENPRPMARANLPPYSQIIQPYEFGENYSKMTMLWLKNLPPLIGSSIGNRGVFPSWCEKVSDSTRRSKTFNGVANAMALQWNF